MDTLYFRPMMGDVVGNWMNVYSSGGDLLGGVLIGTVYGSKAVVGYAPVAGVTDEDLADGLLTTGVCVKSIDDLLTAIQL